MKYFSMFTGIGGFECGIERSISNKQSSEIKQDRQMVMVGRKLITCNRCKTGINQRGERYYTVHQRWRGDYSTDIIEYLCEACYQKTIPVLL